MKEDEVKIVKPEREHFLKQRFFSTFSTERYAGSMLWRAQ